MDKKPTKRETVTLSRRMYKVGEMLPEGDRAKYHIILLDNLFYGKEIQTESLSEALRIAISLISPELRKLQTKFNNGSQKKSMQSTVVLNCSKNKSEQQANNKRKNLAHASYYNIYSANTKYSALVQTNEQTNSGEAEAGKEPLKSHEAQQLEWYEEILEDKAEPLEQLDSVLYSRFMTLVHKISRSLGDFSIQGELLPPVKVLERYVDLFCREPGETIEKLSYIFNEVDAKATNKNFNITNKYKYLVSALYSVASGL